MAEQKTRQSKVQEMILMRLFWSKPKLILRMSVMGRPEHVSVEAEVDKDLTIMMGVRDESSEENMVEELEWVFADKGLSFPPLEKGSQRQEILAAIMTDQSLAAWSSWLTTIIKVSIGIRACSLGE